MPLRPRLVTCLAVAGAPLGTAGASAVSAADRVVDTYDMTYTGSASYAKHDLPPGAGGAANWDWEVGFSWTTPSSTTQGQCSGATADDAGEGGVSSKPGPDGAYLMAWDPRRVGAPDRLHRRLRRPAARPRAGRRRRARRRVEPPARRAAPRPDHRPRPPARRCRLPRAPALHALLRGCGGAEPTGWLLGRSGRARPRSRAVGAGRPWSQPCAPSRHRRSSPRPPR